LCLTRHPPIFKQESLIFAVASGKAARTALNTLYYGDNLEAPSVPMLREAKIAGYYRHEMMGREYDQISIVTVKEIVEDGKRLDIPMSLEVLAEAQRAIDSKQSEF
jgi:hypothetical protein